MANIDYIVIIDGINDRISFFDSLLSFYAPLDVILTTWGKLPAEAKKRLSSFKLPCSLLRRLVAHESRWHLNKQSKDLITECFCKDHILEVIACGIRKGDTPLWFCRSWNDISADGSDLIDDGTLLGWLENLKVKGIIDSFEKIIGKEFNQPLKPGKPLERSSQPPIRVVRDLMKITLIDKIKTDWHPYTITFPSDGSWLTYGDGNYYGGGHIGCIKPGHGIVTQVTFSDILPDDKRNHISISGLCFDGKGHFLAVAAWSFTHSYYPAMLFRIDGNHIVPHTSFLDSPQYLKQLHIGNRGYATGILLHQGQIIIRRSVNSSDQVFSAWRLPVEIDTKNIPYHATSSRMIPLKNAVATCYNKSLLITEIRGTYRSQTHTLPSPHQGEAITVNAAGNTIITGGHDGSIAFWEVSYSVDGLPNIQLISTVPPLEKPSQLTGRKFYYYDPESIVAACYIADSNLFAVAEASGRVSVWREKEVLHTWFVPAGSPRAMASHPTQPILAIGSKMADERGINGMIVLYDLEV